MADKPGRKPTSSTPQPPAQQVSDAGTMVLDDRGNVTWEWKDEGDLLADDTLGTVDRVRALVDPRLKVADDDDDPGNPIKSNPKGTKSGYNPYNSDGFGKQAWKKKRDLRELSKWIELKKRTAAKDET